MEQTTPLVELHTVAPKLIKGGQNKKKDGIYSASICRQDSTTLFTVTGKLQCVEVKAVYGHPYGDDKKEKQPSYSLIMQVAPSSEQERQEINKSVRMFLENVLAIDEKGKPPKLGYPPENGLVLEPFFPKELKWLQLRYSMRPEYEGKPPPEIPADSSCVECSERFNMHPEVKLEKYVRDRKTNEVKQVELDNALWSVYLTGSIQVVLCLRQITRVGEKIYPKWEVCRVVCSGKGSGRAPEISSAALDPTLVADMEEEEEESVDSEDGDDDLLQATQHSPTKNTSQGTAVLRAPACESTHDSTHVPAVEAKEKVAESTTVSRKRKEGVVDVKKEEEQHQSGESCQQRIARVDASSASLEERPLDVNDIHTRFRQGEELALAPREGTKGKSASSRKRVKEDTAESSVRRAAMA